ncbi:MAG TPA: FtsX-like permease family protein, partial [Candidatus Acidoferrales bacterium]|nr:FtsX-like permease family protein [Candidatus Acidoferrales bacterium]
WRVFGFGGALVLGVTCLFALAPALRASGVSPVHALKGGENPHSKRRLMHGLAGAQVAFCFLVLFVAGLFVTTFRRLAHVPTGFSAERILVLDTVAKTPQTAAIWEQAGEDLRSQPGVEKVALMDRPLLDNFSWNHFVSVNGGPPNGVLAYFRRITPGWLDTMKVRLLDGRDFRPEDASPHAAIVNEAFAKTYFDGQDPVGKAFALPGDKGDRSEFQIVGLVADTVYNSIRAPMLPVAFVPFDSLNADGAPETQREGAFIVRTGSAKPMALAQMLRQEVTKARPELRVSRVRTQREINEAQTVRERLLAVLAAFFGAMALLLAAVGLYGVLHFSILQRRREIGIRIAVGAGAGSIGWLVIRDVFVSVTAGGVAGLALGLISVRYIQALFYQVKPTDLPMLFFPSVAIFAAAFVAALPGVIQALRIDPVTMLRTD